MELYIGNATRQDMVFNYRMLEARDIRRQTIPVGAQVKISGDLAPPDIDYIVKQHAKYGLVNQDGIDRTRAFHGTCYSVGKPITKARLTYLMETNLSVMVEQGKEIRRANAIAQSHNLSNQLQESGRPERISALDMTVQQENTDPRNDVPQFSEGSLVTEDGSRKPGSPRAVSTKRKRGN